jgi:pimeloyl-ACP methyl ester carboxylesterase/class 3 adenylate cyclase
VTMRPETKYVKSGEVHIAYQVFGEGPFDIVFIPGFVSNVEWYWEAPPIAEFFQRLASFSRFILFDKRGTGLSDRVPIAELPTLEQRMDDVRAVLDAVGSKQAVVFGVSEGGPMAALFAATYPNRTSGLILYGAMAKWMRSADYPWAPDHEGFEGKGRFAPMVENWGTAESLKWFGPTVAEAEPVRQWWAMFLRLGASPAASVALDRMNLSIDIRPLLSAIAVPTLVLHRTGDMIATLEEGRYLAEHIPGAKFVELAGTDHVPVVGGVDAIINEVQEFVTGERGVVEPDRVLATILFTDIVNSTGRVAEMGDQRSQDLLDMHHALLRKQIDRFHGRAIRSTGDGILATFDGPARSIRCILAVVNELRRLGIEIRAGLHTGEIDLVGNDIGGIAVHIAARVMAKAGASEVWTSSTVKDLVTGSGITFGDRGMHSLKGIPGEWHLFSVEH